MASSVFQCKKEMEVKEDILTCNFCSLPYDNETHQAKSLPCLHTYCKSCLEEQALLYKGAKFNCPECAYVVTLPSVDYLPNDFIVENLKESRELLESDVSCGSCHDEGNLAVCFCHDCAKFLCQRCADEHKKLESETEHMHKLSTIAELKDSLCNLVQHKQCDKHPMLDLTLLCENCNVPICDFCINDGHAEHYFAELKSTILDVTYRMKALSAIAKITNQNLIEKRATIEALQEKLTENFNQSEDDLHASEEELIIMIRSQYSIALCNLKHLYKTEMTPLTTSLDTIDSLTAQISRTCKVADQACDLSSPSQILMLHNQIKARFSHLKTAVDLLPETKTDKETEFGLTTKHHHAMGQINKSLQSVGDVSINCNKSWDYRKLSTTMLVIGCLLCTYPLRKHILALFGK